MHKILHSDLVHAATNGLNKYMYNSIKITAKLITNKDLQQIQCLSLSLKSLLLILSNHVL